MKKPMWTPWKPCVPQKSGSWAPGTTWLEIGTVGCVVF